MIQRLTDATAELVVELHKKVLGHTLNAQMGSGFLRRLYVATNNSTDNGFCYIFMDENRVLGFISFCLDHARLETEIMGSLRFKEKAMIFRSLLCRPWLLPALLRQQLFSKYVGRHYSQPYTTILTLGVSPDAHWRGIGRQLVDAARETVRRRGAGELFVDTEETNTQAALFYRKYGFRQVAVKYGNIVLKTVIV